MDINSMAEDYRPKEKNCKTINRSFYTEKIKDSDKENTKFKKIKSILMKKLL